MSIIIDPPYWFSGMEDQSFQLMISGLESLDTSIDVNLPTRSIKRVEDVCNGYVILDIELTKDIVPGTYDIKIDGICYPYEIRQKKVWLPRKDSISVEDSIYLLMPDRFARGTKNNSILKKIRRDPNARHGGNIAGIIEHLDYITSLGFTSLWLTPVLENNMPNEGSKGQYSFYHGYAITDFYNIDFHFGSLIDYIRLVKEAHLKNIKVIKDFVFNHCGSNHPWFHNPPMDDWFSINEDGSWDLTNYKISTIFDPYAPESGKKATIDGWFTPNMPNLNLHNPYLLQYMIQMTIWWIETANIDAIRMDTYPYVDIMCMIKWQKRIQLEYPGFTVIAETWEPEAAYTAKIQEQVYAAIPECSFVVMDFAFQRRITDMFKTGNALHIYNHFAGDYLYRFPKRVMAFLDNHDMPRWLSEFHNTTQLKQALAILLTTPRIPQLLYGTEILLSGDGRGTGDGNFRQDFPGGWSEDKINKFLSNNRSRNENSVIRFISRLLNWRRNNPHLLAGRMTHYIPEENVIVFFRESDIRKVMVIINLSSKRRELPINLFHDELSSYSLGIDVINGRKTELCPELKMKLTARSIKILNLE